METLCRYATDAKHRGTTHAKRRDRGQPATLDDQKHERDRQQQTDRSHPRSGNRQPRRRNHPTPHHRAHHPGAVIGVQQPDHIAERNQHRGPEHCARRDNHSGRRPTARAGPAATASTTTPTLIDAVVTTIDRLLRNIVTATMDLTGPGAPLDNPLAWTILAWTRRTFFNEPNNAATPAAVNATATAVTPIVQEPVDISSPNASGAVTVKIVATDPLGRPLTYWVLTPPAPATGAVTPGVTPGEFTYTPTTDARVSAATGGPTSLALHSCERIHAAGISPAGRSVMRL